MNTTEGAGGKLASKIALITGGTSGIGLATAKRFVSEGAYVFITGRREAELASAEREIGKNVRAIQGDVARLEDLDRLFAQIQQLKGRLDVIFANAGTARFGALGTITEEFFDSLFGANVKGLLFTVQKALPLMPPGGVIVLNASVGGYKGRPANGVYSATKAAVRSFARTWTNDLKDRQIRVNAISPGVTETHGDLPGARGAIASVTDPLKKLLLQFSRRGQVVFRHQFCRTRRKTSASDLFSPAGQRRALFRPERQIR